VAQHSHIGTATRSSLARPIGAVCAPPARATDKTCAACPSLRCTRQGLLCTRRKPRPRHPHLPLLLSPLSQPVSSRTEQECSRAGWPALDSASRGSRGWRATTSWPCVPGTAASSPHWCWCDSYLAVTPPTARSPPPPAATGSPPPRPTQSLPQRSSSRSAMYGPSPPGSPPRPSPGSPPPAAWPRPPSAQGCGRRRPRRSSRRRTSGDGPTT